MTLTDAPEAVTRPDAAAVEDGVTRARDRLIAKQSPDGYWCAELQGDGILESEYILFKFIMGQEHEPDLPAVANYLRDLQEPHGGWSQFPGGPPDVSGTVKAYYVLKLMGDDPDAPHMAEARELILRLGGAEKCNTFTRFFFAALGQISYDAVPSIPPEIVFLPRWFYFNLYNLSAWTRTMILPLGIVNTLRYTRTLRDDQRMDELYVDQAAANRLSDPVGWLPKDWQQAFVKLDGILKRYERLKKKPLRQRALNKAEAWINDHLKETEGLGAIFPAMVYQIVAFKALGYADDHPVQQREQKHLRDFFVPLGNERIRLQPCLSPTWDTGIALHALAESGVTQDDAPAQAATRWLLSKECKIASDWALKVPNVPPAGWYFEFNNPHYPDTDDTAMVAMALRRVGGQQSVPAIERATQWLRAMQNADGGWAAFDKTDPRPILEKVPFADHNAMQDPSCPDITGRILEGLGHNGFSIADPNAKRAVAYLQSTQDSCGAWWGRWGVNYIYGTWQVLTGLKSIGFDTTADFCRRATDWLRSVQRPDGSFGETCESYDDPSLKGTGTPTASQTAWAAMALMAVHGANDDAVHAAVAWLLRRQRDDGDWDEPEFTGTGFPKVFYLRYHLYRHYFPLTALARYRRLMAAR